MIDRLWITILTITMIACQQPRPENVSADEDGSPADDTITEVVTQPVEPSYVEPATEPERPSSPIFGYRFSITGDFDGDGRRETMYERFLSRRTDKETVKFYAGLEYDKLVEYNAWKRPLTIVTSKNNIIDTLKISDDPQSLGLAWLKNEGDLNGDGGDEVSYVPNWADWSETNTCHLMTYSGGKWHELVELDIRDWMIPELPGLYTEENMCGITAQTPVKNLDSLNRLMEKQLLNFPGFFKKIRKNRVRAIFINSELMEDTVEMELSGLKQIALPDRSNVKD